jgi:hypothetical protein
VDGQACGLENQPGGQQANTLSTATIFHIEIAKHASEIISRHHVFPSFIHLHHHEIIAPAASNHLTRILEYRLMF